VAGGWWLVAGGWWLVAGGWWLVAGGWWFGAADFALHLRISAHIWIHTGRSAAAEEEQPTGLAGG
jgi:hypothetical protein